jgi:hypothetical protein
MTRGFKMANLQVTPQWGVTPSEAEGCARSWFRTPDLLDVSQALCRLS